jgi:hypothetical protein
VLGQPEATCVGHLYIAVPAPVKDPVLVIAVWQVALALVTKGVVGAAGGIAA